MNVRPALAPADGAIEHLAADGAIEHLAADGAIEHVAAVGHGTPGVFDELRGAVTVDGATPPQATPCWRAFFAALPAAGAAGDDLAARAARAQRRVREDGATYNVHAPGADTSRAWPLQLLPVIVAADDWAAIEAGVVQRARLLNATLADVYGAQTLLHDAVLPPSLVFAHPQYLRAAHGIRPAGGVHLHMAAFDLARGAEGRWWVLAQRLQAPSGLGYLLENRLIIGRELHEAFDALRVQRVDAAFEGLLGALRGLSGAGARARVVLLTPGPLHETYFEQVFLARHLGIALVEGSDLTVRERRVFLKTMQGLERVHVVLRRVDDEWLDPLELRADSALGVPGLMQAARAGEVVIANAPGAGVLESPGLAAFWPGVAQRLLGQELQLPASTHWWCGEATVWQAQRARLEDFVVAATFPGGATTHGFDPVVAADLGAAVRAALAGRIDADPAAFTLQARVRPSLTPVWDGGAIDLRPTVLRVFALADGRGGWSVLPGGMARVASHRERGLDPWLSMQHGSASADLWVIARDASQPGSLPPVPLSPSDGQEQPPAVTSRAAENLFWLGRYTERAEYTVALVRLALGALRHADAALRTWLGELAVWHELVPHGTPAPGDALHAFERALVNALPAAGGPASVGFDLRALLVCAQAVRERLSPDHWRLLQELDHHFEQHMASVLAPARHDAAAAPVADVLGVLGRTATHLSAVTGAQTDRMVRDDGWRLMSVGRQIERLDTLCHALARGLGHGLAGSEEGFDALLGLFDGVITYRARFQGRRELLPMIELLVLDTDNTRSIAWVARTLRERLRKLARVDGAWAAEVTDALPAPETWPIDELVGLDAGARPAALIERLDGMAQAARALSDAIAQRLFAHVAEAERTVWL